METPIDDYNQEKITGGTQKVILNKKETAETDELDPKFQQDTLTPKPQEEKYEPGDDAKTELI